MNISLNTENFFKYYIFDNYSQNLAKQDQKIARAASIIFAVLTLGMGLLVTRLCFYDKDYEIRLIKKKSSSSPSQKPILSNQPVLNLESLNPKEDGLTAKSLYRSAFFQSFNSCITHWDKREDKEKKFWNHEELAASLKVNEYDLNNLCEYLQILQTNIPTELLDYYFSTAQYAFIDPQLSIEMESISNIANNTSTFACFKYGRFPGLKYKEAWKIKDLAQYLAVQEDAMRLELKGTIQGETIETEKLLPEVKRLDRALGRFRTQNNSIRFATRGRILKT